MRTISMRIPMSTYINKDDVIRTVLDWLNGSSLYCMKGINWQGEHTFSYKYQSKTLNIIELSSKNILAIHYEILKYKEHSKEVMEFVYNEDKKLLFIRYQISDKTQKHMFRSVGKLPYVIRLMILRGMFSSAYDVVPAVKPIFITRNNNYKLAERTVKGVLSNYIPVVYITKTPEYDYPTDPGRLASFLAGRAVVMAEEDPLVRDRLAEIEGTSLMRGYVTIYYPNADSVKTILNYRNYSDSLEMSKEITRYVNQYWSLQMLNDDQTWDGVNKQILNEQKAQLEVSHKKISAENEQLYKELDNELTDNELTVEMMQEKIEMLNSRLIAVQAERDGLQVKLDNLSAKPVLYAGDENELYSGEIKAIVLDALSDQKEKSVERSRRYDVLDDLLKSNGYHGELKKKRDAVKKALISCSSTETICKELKEAGIDSEHAGKHIKLTYHGDGRYASVMALTPSDHRSAKNLATLLNKTML